MVNIAEIIYPDSTWWCWGHKPSIQRKGHKVSRHQVVMAEDHIILYEGAADENDTEAEADGSAPEYAGGDVDGRVAPEEERSPKKLCHPPQKNTIRAHMTFDRSLPGTHAYLGNDLDDIRGRTVYEDNAEIKLPLLPLPLMPVPGQVIPLHLFHQHLVSTLSNIAKTDKTFGIITYSSDTDEDLSALSQIGCTAEIFSMKDETDESTGLSTLRAKARARQRFRVLEMQHEITGIVVAKVQILPEVSLPRCLEEVRPLSHNKFCFSHIQKHTFGRHKVDQFSCASLTYWPDWLYKMHDKDLLKSQMVEQLYTWNETFRSVSLPAEAADLSYWVAQNVLLDNGMRINLMSLDCTIQRLQTEIRILRKCTVLCCATCREPIARKEDVFSMSEEGPSSAYVNPGGHVHETLTVRKTRNLHLIGRPSSEHSWFPGYSWTIAQCNICNNHMGWHFTATKKKLTPSKFWGLCRSSLVPDLQVNERNDE